MKESGQEAWTATQVRALAATGLANSHLQPFVRLLYSDPRQVNGDKRSRTILVASRDADDDVICRRHRERNGQYTVRWTDNGSGEVFNVNATVDWVELQLWNRFDNGVDMFLGSASVSLRQLHEQCKVATNDDKAHDSPRTGALWFPLQSSETNGLASHLSLEIKCVFTSNPKVFHNRETINKRNSDKREDDSQKSVADPAFAFTQPFLAVDWALLASTSTRRLFFHVRELYNKRQGFLLTLALNSQMLSF